MVEFLGIVNGSVVLAQDGAAGRSGMTCTTVFWPLLMLAGVLKCSQIARRETTSGLCVWALAIVLMAWGVASVGSYIARSADDPVMSRLVYLATGAAILLAIAVSIVLAIIGLAQYRPEFVQGRKQAIWSLAFNGLLVVLIGWGVIAAINKRLDSAPAASVNQPAVGEPIRFEEFNFEARKPSSRWTQLKAASIAEDASVVFRRSRPEILWIVIAEDYGDSLNLDNETLLQIAESNGRSAADTNVFTPGKPTTLTGLPALQATAEATINGQNFSYDYRILAHNGFAYQLVTFCKRSERQHLRAAADELADGFALIDPERVGTGGTEAGESDTPLDRLSLSEAGLSIDLVDAGWTTWNDMAIDYPEASAGAMLSQQCMLGVVALPLDEIDVSDRELYGALLKTAGYTIDDSTFQSRESVSVDDTRGYRFTAEYDSAAGPMEARLYIVRNDQWAYLINGWVAKGRSDLLDRLDATIRRAQIEPARPQDLPDRSQAHAIIYNAIGLSAYNAGDYGRALQGFEKAYTLHPGNETYADNTIDAYEELGQFEQGITFAKRHLQQYPDHHEARANLAYQLTYDDAKTLEAIEQYRLAFEAGYQSDFYLLDYVRAIRNQGESEKALALIVRYAIDRTDSELTIERCQIMGELGRHDEAITILESRSGEALPDPMLLAEWVRAHLRADRTHDAVELGQALTNQHPELSEVWYIRGIAERDLEWYPQARASFQEALGLSNVSYYQEQLDYVEDLLGRGDNTLVRTAVDPVELPTTLAATSSPQHPDANQHAAWVKRDVRAYAFRPGQSMRTTIYKEVKITDNEALEFWSTLTLDFDSQYERLFVNELTVRDASGQVVGRGELDHYFVIDEQQDGINSDDKTLHVPVPGLAVGHTLSYVVSYETLGEPSLFPFRRRRFVSSYPTDRMTVYVQANPTEFNVVVSPEIREEAVEGGRAWTVEAVPVYRWEPLMPDLDTIFPLLSLGPVDQTWEGLALDYLADLEDALATPDGFEAQARGILGDARDPQEVITRATEYVQHHLTYEAIAFGVRGTIPHTIEQITAQRFGDCKDHALLLAHLLRIGGVDSHLAVVHNQRPLQKKLPTLSQFNHMVVYLPDIKGGLIIDATDKSHAALRGTPIGVNRRTLLILDPEQPRLVEAPPMSESNEYHSQRQITITDTGDAEVDEVLTATGPWAEGLLEYFRNSNRDEYLGNLQKSLDAEDGIRLIAVSTSDLDNLSIPLRVTLKYKVPGAFEQQGDDRFGRLPGPWELYYMAPTFLPNRQSEFERTVALSFRSDVDVVLPPGLTAASPRATESPANPAISSYSEARATPTGLRLNSEITYHSGRFTPKLYSDYFNATESALRAVRPTLRLTTESPD